MAKRGLKMKKENYIIISLALVSFILLLYTGINSFKIEPPESGGGGQGGNYANCTNDYQCPPRVEPYCTSNSTFCNYTTYYKCILNKCVPINCSHFCRNCPYGCINQSCMFFVNKSDLIITDVNYFTNPTNEVIVNISVKNIGYRTSPETNTRILLNSEGTVFNLNTRMLYPFESLWLNFTYHQPSGTNYSLRATADSNNAADELREDNNEFLTSILMPPH
jgi:hypothetical protein